MSFNSHCVFMCFSDLPHHKAPDLQASVLVMAIPQRVAGHDKTSVIVESQWGPLALLLFNIDPTKYASPCAC